MLLSTTTSSSSLCARTARRAVVAVAIVGGLLAIGNDVSAQQAELPVNALAPEITAQADGAIAAYDEFVASDDLADYLEYAEMRTATARLAARQLGYNEFAMINAWASTDLDHQRAVLAAMSQIGVPYRSLASVEDEGFDCSGLTSFAWGSTGVELNRISGDQISAAAKVNKENAEPGDLVYYPGHVMMYLGVDEAIVHSFQTGRTVEIDTISKRRANSVRFGDPID